MNESRADTITERPINEYLRPDLREWLINLKRDLLRKVKQIDELIANLPIDDR
jgi:hypothetical protein